MIAVFKLSQYTFQTFKLMFLLFEVIEKKSDACGQKESFTTFSVDLNINLSVVKRMHTR